MYTHTHIYIYICMYVCIYMYIEYCIMLKIITLPIFGKDVLIEHIRMALNTPTDTRDLPKPRT